MKMLLFSLKEKDPFYFLQIKSNQSLAFHIEVKQPFNTCSCHPTLKVKILRNIKSSTFSKAVNVTIICKEQLVQKFKRQTVKRWQKILRTNTAMKSQYLNIYIRGPVYEIAWQSASSRPSPCLQSCPGAAAAHSA